MYSVWHKFVNINYKFHLLLAFVIRLVLILYSNYHDSISEVPYTDVDYKVFTDAARHILNGKSPYNRHTYRYSPLVAIFVIPNLIVHRNFGKIIFSVGDIIVALLIRHRKQLKQHNKHGKLNIVPTVKSIANGPLDTMVNISMLIWLYNPLTITISTRGNCDSLAAFFVLLTLYTLQCQRSYFLSGIIHGISIHFRLYPVMYSLAFFMFLSKFAVYTTEDRRKSNNTVMTLENTSTMRQVRDTENSVVLSSKGGHKILPCKEIKERTIFKKEYLLYVVPNLDQLKLITGCLISLFSLTYIFYNMYGYKFLYETYIYHFIRRDTRHNFSLYFYLQYLTMWVKNIGIWQKALVVLPQIVLLLVFSMRYGLNKFSLNFSILTQTIVMVIYNSVLTSQYFLWIMAVLPLCVWQINMPKNMVFFLLTIWFAAQGVWLLPAYLLEFKGENTFMFIWIQGVSFFCVNVTILGRLISCFLHCREKIV
ncbi:hypothetical protein NQ318_022149 [Aromia moschata]|uniref:GPI alpha-1,4-mannosyltransferase I, catalytic subunit n=1 Tax=Aromia moschata TaxID=1265417 RepID=A0AAV8Z5W8_9CUCU|nr:hypothetical protein NQ318_022149 [Aromia moschata]